MSLSSSLPLQMLADIRPNEEHAKEHIERSPVTTMAHIVPDVSEHEVGPHSAAKATLLTIQCLRACFPGGTLPHPH